MHTRIRYKKRTAEQEAKRRAAILAYEGKLSHIKTTSDDVARRRAEEALREGERFTSQRGS